MSWFFIEKLSLIINYTFDDSLRLPKIYSLIIDAFSVYGDLYLFIISYTDGL